MSQVNICWVPSGWILLLSRVFVWVCSRLCGCMYIVKARGQPQVSFLWLWVLSPAFIYLFYVHECVCVCRSECNFFYFWGSGD